MAKKKIIESSSLTKEEKKSINKYFLSHFKEAEQERQRAVKLVMDLYYSVKYISGRLELRDLVRLAKRIKNKCGTK